MGMGGATMAGEAKIDARTRARLAKLVAMLAATSDGEVLNAARAITSTLKAVGADINDLAALVNVAPAPLETMIQSTARDRHVNMLRAMAATSIRGLHDAKTSQFLRHMVTLLDNGRLPSNAQTQWLMNIYFGRG